MNSSIRTFVGLALLAAPFATGCARTAPFDQMDQAQLTVMRLTNPPPAQPAPVTAQPGFPGIPLPPELQAGANAVLQGAQAAGLPIPPGLIPGMQPMQPAMPAQPPPPMFNGLAIVASVPITDDGMKSDILDVFGKEDSFQSSPPAQCQTVPGLGIAMVRPSQPNVDLLVSFSCNKAMGVGFAWPYKKDALTTESSQKLSQIYQALFGMPVPPGS